MSNEYLKQPYSENLDRLDHSTEAEQRIAIGAIGATDLISALSAWQARATWPTDPSVEWNDGGVNVVTALHAGSTGLMEDDFPFYDSQAMVD